MTVSVRRECATPAGAAALLRAVAADTPEFVTLRIDGNALTIELTARTPGSARATLEDLMACLAAADRLASSEGASATEGGRDRSDEGG